jgi:hypothetical protein
MGKKIIKSSTYLTEVKTLSDRIVAAQQPIRILEAVKWDDSIKQEFFASHCKKPPVASSGLLALMGDVVEPRRDFIVENALNVGVLDV